MVETGNQSNERRERLRIAGASARDKAAMTFRGRTRAPDRGKGQEAVTHALPPRQTQHADNSCTCGVRSNVGYIVVHPWRLRLRMSPRRTHCY